MSPRGVVASARRRAQTWQQKQPVPPPPQYGVEPKQLELQQIRNPRVLWMQVPEAHSVLRVQFSPLPSLGVQVPLLPPSQ